MEKNVNNDLQAKGANSAPRSELIAYLDARLDRLVDRSIEIAKLNGYAPFTTTIRAAWVEAISSLIQSLDIYLAQTELEPKGPKAVFDYLHDPCFAKMRKIARLHRSRGITMTMYIGLLKHFRNLFIEEAALQNFAHGQTEICSFFDAVELSITEDWSTTDQKTRLRELQESTHASTLDKDRYFAIFESLKNPAFLLGKSYAFINANQAGVELYFENSEAGGLVYGQSDWQRETLKSKVLEILDAAIGGQQSIWLQTRLGRRYFDINMRELHDVVENTAIGHVVLLNDMTHHRRETEKAQKSERGMSRFLATMSHEIRTPLHSVLGASQLLRTAKPERAEHYLDLLDDAGQTLLQTLNNVLNYSKLENGAPEPTPMDINLAAKIDEFKEFAMLGPNRSQSELRFHLASNIPEIIAIDWTLTHQVLSNLVSNAIRADEDNEGVDISILGEGDFSKSGAHIRFEVRDFGSGIPALNARAFSRPYEKAIAHHTKSGGAGLGLVIAHNIVEAMGGEIGYRNCERGALVWFEIPVSQSGASLQSALPPPNDSLVMIEGNRLLLVDDDEVSSIVTSGQFEEIGFRVERTDTIASAQKKARSSAFDIFVVDYILPDGKGSDLVRELRQNLDRSACFVALTANVEAIESDPEMRKLFDMILAKPVDLKQLAAAFQIGTLLNDASLTTRNLDGLSPATISAMLRVFEQAWENFRADLDREIYRHDIEEFKFKAHKLRGGAAILGLSEIEALLSEIDSADPADYSSAQFQSQIQVMNRELSEFASWSELLCPKGA